jgi:hypothetical protein
MERLTRAIRSAVETVERRNPDCFRYNGVSLRGAVERRLYYDALIDPMRLNVLCKAGAPPTELSEWLPARSAPTRIRDAVALCKAWVRLMYYGLFRAVMRPRATVERIQLASDHLASNQPEFVFCVLHPRFIGFFLPIIETLGRHRCALLCEGGSAIVEEAIRQQIAICQQQYARLRPGAITRPPRALFPVYSVFVIELLKALGTLRRCRPRVVVFAEAASFQEEVVARAARYLGIATVRVQHGRAGVISPGYYDMPYDKMLMWGEGFIDRLKPTSPDCCYVTTGSPLLDKIPDAAPEGQLAVFMESNPTVTIISQPECANVSRQDYAALVFIVDHVLRSSEGTNILVRLHPADAATDFHRLAEQWPQRMRVTRAQDFSLNAVLARSTVVVGLYSTVLSEAVAFGVVPVVLRLGNRHRIFPSPEDAGAGVLATNPDSAVAAIRELVADPLARARYRDQMEAFTRHYFGPLDGGAVARIAQHIENAEHIEKAEHAEKRCNDLSRTP